MLTRIHIRDFAIIDELELEFGPGMSVLTGETGAGKSILIDALGLVLGDRADSGTVREGADKTEITLALEVREQAPILQWLDEHELGTDDECLLRRVISRDGRSKAYVNGSPTSLQIMRQLGEMLVDIHGQHEHVSLLRADTQRQLLDAHAGNSERLARLDACYRELRALEDRLQSLTTHSREREERLDLLRFQVQELADLRLGADELDALEEEHRRLAHAERLKEASLMAYSALYAADEATLDAGLGKITATLAALVEFDSRLQEPADLLGAAQAQLREAASALRHYADSMDLDPERFAWIESRLADIHQVARKHRTEPTRLPDRQAELETELASLQGAGWDMEGMRERLQELRDEYHSMALAIHEARAAAAEELSKAVTGAMQALGMAGGRFDIDVEFADKHSPTAHGLDRITFNVSANPGQPLKPLQKVASGGELSRISLALQVLAAQGLSVPTLIFDEVDAGIGGAVAEVVGRRLRALGERRQVLCVTHLAQVAAQAHYHFRVSKRSHGQTTRTQVAELEVEERVEEVARMLGGVELTEKTRAHAKEMISRAVHAR
jgi:DNA repair protein RecN (Recombination protein N)